ncbi:MAG: ThiF family adenylyltransferase [Bacteroidales bacterium]|jgi:adenylyltransferase/sulfurtransferase|nr:ThiF family adenylyltransferase [Bacteroidales bacterium]
MENTENRKKWGEDVFSLLSWFKMDKVKNAKVLVAGAGALGNEALKNLALFGVGNIIVVDFDKIEYSNLTRSVLFRPEDADKGLYKADIAAKRLMEINPTINVIPVCGNLATDVGLGVYRRVDVVLGCLDSLTARTYLNRLSFRAGKVWIDGGIGNLEGQVSGYEMNESCYECSLMEEEVADMENRIMSCPAIGQENEEAGRVPTTPVITSIIAAIQVQEAMKIIHKEDLDKGVFTTLIGTMFNYEGMHPDAGIFDFKSYRKDCVSHEYWEDIVEIPQLSADTKISEALDIIKKTMGVENVEINLRNDIFTESLVVKSDNRKFKTMFPKSKISDHIKSSKELRDISFLEGGLYINEYENIDQEFPFMDLTLKQIGIPYLDVIQITTEKGYAYVELTADKKYYEFLF